MSRTAPMLVHFDSQVLPDSCWLCYSLTCFIGQLEFVVCQQAVQEACAEVTNSFLE